MRLLLDTPIPATATTLSTPELTLERWEGDQVPDAEFIRRAADAGFGGVVLLGRASLSRPDLVTAAIQSSMGLVVISVNDPIRAPHALAAHLRRLPAEVGTGLAIVVSSHDSSTVDLETLRNEMEGQD